MAKHENDGRGLEQLVAMIEKLHLPAGFAIATNRRLFDATGKQAAEFDVVIEDHVGTVSLQCLIECRDRPSEGPAPVEWIEQLDGRRRHHGFAAVMAVSTTSFSTPAVEFAESVGIELRTLRDLTANDIGGMFPQTVPMGIRDARLTGVRVALTPLECERPTRSPVMTGSNDDPVFVESGAVADAAPVSVMDLWRRLILQEAVWKGVRHSESPKPVQLQMFDFVTTRYEFVRDGVTRPVAGIEFEGTLQEWQPAMPLIQAADYVTAGSSESHARVAIWAGPGAGAIRQLILILKKAPAQK